MAQECAGAGYVDNTGKECKGQRGITRCLKFLEENQQEHLTFLKRKKTFTQQEHQ